MYIYATRDSEYNLQPLRSFLKGRAASYLCGILCFLLCAFFPASAQFYEYGQDRGTIRWNHFSSAHYQLIYPRGMDSLAKAFADQLEYFYPHQAKVLDHRHTKMPVVFHHESSFSNGVFVWAPRRLEVFTNPDPNGYPQDWMTQLALHEGRHAFQVSKLNQGLGKALSYVAGEQAVGALTGFLPMWYLEGDAVDAETRFSYSGRGRLPSFEMRMKAILMENDQRYSFSKSLLGSYTDVLPNHYELGYLMVRYGRRTFGDQFWIDMENHVARRPYLVFPTWFSMKKYGVKSKSELYRSALGFYQQHWTESYNRRKPGNAFQWSPAPVKHNTSYRFPQWLSDSAVVALQSGPDQIPAFVRINGKGDASRLFRPGFMNSGRFSYSQGMIVWDEWVPDVRWSNRNFSNIRLYDLHKNQVKELGKRTRYYAPALSGSGNYIAAIEQRTDHSFYLVILDLDGKVLHSVRSPGNAFLQHPAWMDRDSAVVATVSNSTGEYLYRYSWPHGTWKQLFHAGFDDISYPVAAGDKIYFSATFSGIDNIYRYDLAREVLDKITDAAFGAFDPSVNRNTGQVLYADYHATGYRAVSELPDPASVMRINEPMVSTEQVDTDPTPGERQIIDSSLVVSPGEYQPAPYRKLFNAIKIHSWLPLYFNYMEPEAALTPGEVPVKLGATVLTQNLLSTVTGMAAYEYRDKLHYLHTGFRLKGRYPVVDFSMDYGGYPVVNRMDQSDQVPVRPDRFAFRSNIYIPLRINTGKFISYAQPLLGYSYTSDLFPNEDRSGYESGIHRLLYRFFFSSYLRMGSKEIMPRLGFSAFAGLRNAPFDQHNFGSLNSAGITLYVPGPLRHQSIRLRLFTQNQVTDRYLFGNDIPLPRGYADIAGLELDHYSIDYSFPLFYPDLEIGPVMYIKRVRGNLWSDYMQGKDVLVSDPEPGLAEKEFFSYGADLLFDVHFLRIFFPVSMGARVAYIPETGDWKPELLFTIDVN